MRQSLVSSACCLLSLAFGGLPAEELKREIVLTIAGKEHSVPDGGSIEVGGTRIAATLSPRQTFTGNGYRVSLPGHFAFEKDDSEPNAIDYTFDGKNVVLCIYELSNKVDAHEFVNEVTKRVKDALLVEHLQKGKADPLELEGIPIPGDMIIMNFGIIEVRLSLYVVDRAGGSSVLTLQSGTDQEDLDELSAVRTALTGTYRKHP